MPDVTQLLSSFKLPIVAAAVVGVQAGWPKVIAVRQSSPAAPATRLESSAIAGLPASALTRYERFEEPKLEPTTRSIVEIGGNFQFVGRWG